MLERFGQELRNAIRTLGKSPGFAVLSILTLALGIGVNTAMFSIVDGILLKPLTYSDPGRLVTMYVEVPRLSRAYPVLPISAYYLTEWRKRSRSIDGVSALSAVSLNLTGAGDPERLNGVRISADFFTLLGVQPQRGRNFLRDEDQPDKSGVVILSDGLWRRRFGANPQIAGSTIQLNGISRLVAGVMPADFRFPKNEELHRLVKMPEQTDFWIPLAFRPEETQRMVNQNYAAIARLKPGVSLQAASTELNVILKRLPNMPKDFGPQVHLDPLQTDMVARVRPGLMVLMAAVAAVLLISCINIANLLLTRATNRRREIAVRAALGATRLQLCIRPLAESLAISFAGAATGILTAYWLIHLVLLKLPIDLPRMDEVALDGRTLAFAIFVTLLSALSCALAPAWRYASGDPARGYQDGGRSSTGGQSATHLRSALVSLESGMCALLLIVAGLLVHSFIKITGLDQGFRTSNVIAAEVTLSGNNYQQGQARGAFYQSVLAKLQSLPGTEAAGAVSVLPLTGETNIIGIAPEGAPNPSWGQAPQAEYRYASAGYFAAAGIPVLRGNVFEDRPDGPRVAVISARTADRVWHGQDPIGRRFNSPQSQGNGITVVGIVGDVRSTGLDREPPFMVYLPVAQDTPGGITFVVRTSDPNPAIRQAVAAVDRAIPVAKIRRLDQLIMDAAAVRRFQMLLLTCFASMALLLAAIGMYGVVSYSVAQRRSELGIRIALGAEYKSILVLVLWGGLKPVIIGLMVGMAGAFIAGRLIGSLLFSVAPFDPVVYASAITLLTLASLAACWIPARTAARTDPITSIRCE
jgi:predicted permease